MSSQIPEVRIGLIGLGSIGRSLTRALVAQQAGRASLQAVLCRPSSEVQTREFLASLGLSPLVTCDPSEFFQVSTNLIIEAAGQQVVRQYAAQALQSGRDLLICATGALTDDVLYAELSQLAAQNNCRLFLPSGALAGLDALASAALAGLDEVVITTRKPPLAWLGTAAETLTDLAQITEQPYCLFEGSAREAARLFPQNINVAATLAYAGIGLDRTIARVFADPTIERNLHQIHARGGCVDLKIEVCGKPSADNPRTSALTAYSIIRIVRNMTAPVVLG